MGCVEMSISNVYAPLPSSPHCEPSKTVAFAPCTAGLGNAAILVSYQMEEKSATHRRVRWWWIEKKARIKSGSSLPSPTGANLQFESGPVLERDGWTQVQVGLYSASKSDSVQWKVLDWSLLLYSCCQDKDDRQCRDLVQDH